MMKKNIVLLLVFFNITSVRAQLHNNPNDYKIKIITGKNTKQILPFVATQVITAFKEYPYLYDGNYEEEIAFRKSLAQHHDTAIAVAYHKEKPIGFLTGYAFTDFGPHFEGSVDLFTQAHLKPEEHYYLGEIIIVPEHRGKQLSSALFSTIEQHAQNLGYKSTCIVTEEHNSHPLKPNNYKSLQPLWNFLGYQKTPLIVHLDWQTHQYDTSVKKETHPLTYWIKQLPDKSS